MFAKILLIVGIFIAISLLLFWIISGGIGRAVNDARSATDSSTSTPFGFIRLPWQPDTSSYGPDVARLLGREGETGYGVGGAGENLKSAEKEYETLEKDIEEAKNFGAPSPHRGKITIYQDGTLEENPSSEYLTLTASWGNTETVDMSGWSLQSALSGVRAFIPRGAPTFILGAVNTQTGIQLSPGASVVISSGYSPVGTSFQENICTGFLNQIQTFAPRLSERCPQSSEAIPLTAENLNAYGEACIDFARSFPACVAPLNDFPANTSPSCRNYLANTLSYNGCVNMYRYRSNFVEGSWRVYLSSSRELWRNTHDVIRLLDAEGRTVDAVTY